MLFDLGAGDRPSPIPPELSEAHSRLRWYFLVTPTVCRTPADLSGTILVPRCLDQMVAQDTGRGSTAFEDHQVGKVPRYPNHWYNS